MPISPTYAHDSPEYDPKDTTHPQYSPSYDPNIRPLLEAPQTLSPIQSSTPKGEGPNYFARSVYTKGGRKYHRVVLKK